MVTQQHVNTHKLNQLMLYIARKSEADPTFGATKLNKLLFFCDFYAYAKFGQPLTGARYQRLPNGPAPRRIVQLQSSLIALKHARVEHTSYHGYPQERLVALSEPDMRAFKAEEIKLIDEIIEDLWGSTAAATSRLSHEQMVGWQIAEDGEDIPYETIFVSPDPPSSVEMEQAKRFAEKHGWLPTS